MNLELIKLPTYYNKGNGNLTVVEKEPFDIKRAFWVHNIQGWRGGHAHKKCEQILVAVHGSITVKAGDWQGVLSDPSVGLYVPTNVRVEFFGPGAVMLVLCSEYFEEDDYIY